ncbi:fldB [Klebsiella pneumoniae]|nr:Flavodoxin [Klebsiella pneumoniae 30684/NJST258_2]AHM83317.1 Flavodoxin [Klebsiella pneumoniae 30660/NJST258_1]CDQ52865.1 fldB [Klebsiella pneumoniae]
MRSSQRASRNCSISARSCFTSASLFVKRSHYALRGRLSGTLPAIHGKNRDVYAMNIGLFYGSSTCYTEMAAEKIRDIIGPELVTLHNLKDDSPALMSQYDVLILGIPTWDFGEIQEDWEAVWDQLDTLNLEGKIVALYGMGDQLGYGEWFLDALGMLHDKLATRGVKFVGYWPTEGYEFTSPKPVIADGQLFVGLALDETNQYDLSDERIQSWCEQILGEMAEHFS